MRAYKFGWLPDLSTFDGAEFSIAPLETSRAAFEHIVRSPRTKDGWFYPPLEPEYWAPGQNAEPLLYTDWFALPATHQLNFREELDDSKRLAAFAVETLGVVYGMQLVLEGWGHFYRTPIKPGRVGDIKFVKNAAASRLVDRTLHFWQEYPDARKNMYGAVHSHMFGCSYGHAFENFAAAYATFDTCWAVHTQLGRPPSGRTPHAERLPALCAYYGLELPEWGIVTTGRSRLSQLRNEYFHESLWGGEPIGLSHPDDVPGIHLELFYFNTRLILTLLGERTGYTGSRGAYEPRLFE